jgi:hypothetical protein
MYNLPRWLVFDGAVLLMCSVAAVPPVAASSGRIATSGSQSTPVGDVFRTDRQGDRVRGCLIGVDRLASAIVVSGVEGVDLILVVDHHTVFSPSDLRDRWQGLHPGIVLSITYSLAGARWVADEIMANSPDLRCSPPPSREGSTSADGLERFHAKRTRRLTGTTGPTGTVHGIVMAVEPICQSLLVRPASGGQEDDVLVAIDNETSVHHGSERASLQQLDRGSKVLVKYIAAGPLNIAQEVSIEEGLQAPGTAHGAAPPSTKVPPNVQLLKPGDFVRQGLATATQFFQQNLVLTAADAAAIKARTRWTPSKEDYAVHLGRDAQGGLVGLAVFVRVPSDLGPVGVAVAFDPTGKVLQAAVTDVSSDLLALADLLRLLNAFLPYTGLPLDARPDPASLAPGTTAAMSRYYAQVIAQGVERAQAVARVSLAAAAR